MIIFPAIDLYEGKAVRLLKGEYDKMTVYSDDPLSTAMHFKECGAEAIHIVDLEGAKYGTAPNSDLVCNIKEITGLFIEVGGGIRNLEILEKYSNAGIDRMIFGTSAATDGAFIKRAVSIYGNKIAVSADIKDGFVSVRGWTDSSGRTAEDFLEEMTELGVSTAICTDISRDGAMKGTNLKLYAELSERFGLNIIASGGVSSLSDVSKLAEMKLYGAIIGKALYTKAVDLNEAIKTAAQYEV